MKKTLIGCLIVVMLLAYGQAAAMLFHGGLALALTNGTDNASFVVPGTMAVASDVTSNWYIATRAGTFVSAYAQVKTAPTGAALIFDVLKSTDHGATFTSIWNATPANRVQVAASSRNGTQTSFDTTSFNAGDVLRIDVIQVGSSVAGANASVRIATSVTPP